MDESTQSGVTRGALVNVQTCSTTGVVQIVFVEKGKIRILIFKPSATPDPDETWTFDLCDIELRGHCLTVFGRGEKYIFKMRGVYKLCEDESDARAHALKDA
jgi:hypothetical protein